MILDKNKEEILFTQSSKKFQCKYEWKSIAVRYGFVNIYYQVVRIQYFYYTNTTWRCKINRLHRRDFSFKFFSFFYVLFCFVLYCIVFVLSCLFFLYIFLSYLIFVICDLSNYSVVILLLFIFSRVYFVYVYYIQMPTYYGSFVLFYITLIIFCGICVKYT